MADLQLIGRGSQRLPQVEPSRLASDSCGDGMSCTFYVVYRAIPVVAVQSVDYLASADLDRPGVRAWSRQQRGHFPMTRAGRPSCAFVQPVESICDAGDL